MNNLKKFANSAAYSAATLVRPAVSLIETSGEIRFDPDVFNGAFRVYYNIADASNEVALYAGGSSSSSASASESGDGGGSTPSRMWIDGVEVEVSNTYRFANAGTHYVDYFFFESDYNVPDSFCQGITNITKVVIDANAQHIGMGAFADCTSLVVICKATTPPSLGDSAVFGSSVSTIYVPASVVNTYKEDVAWGDYTSIIQAM